MGRTNHRVEKTTLEIIALKEDVVKEGRKKDTITRPKHIVKL